MQIAFNLFTRYRDVIQLRDEIDDVDVLIPFGRMEGLEGSIDRIVDRMEHDIAGHVPHAIRTARNDVLAVTRADVLASIRNGVLIVR
jgi:hypothetical protein